MNDVGTTWDECYSKYLKKKVFFFGITFGSAPLCFCPGLYGLFVALTGMNDVGTTLDECYSKYLKKKMFFFLNHL